MTVENIRMRLVCGGEDELSCLSINAVPAKVFRQASFLDQVDRACFMRVERNPGTGGMTRLA